MNKLFENFEKAKKEVEVIADAIVKDMARMGSHQFSRASALEMAKERWLFGSLYELKHKQSGPKKVTKKKVTNNAKTK